MQSVFALATPPAKSAICVFRVSGKGCHDQLAKIINNKNFEIGRFHVREFFNKGGLVDKAGLVAFKGPNSYTGEDSFEVYAHGSLGIMSSFVDLFKSVGFDEAAGGEFTKRAFLNNKISLNEAESLGDLIDSVDERGVLLSTKSLFGGLTKKVLGFANDIDKLRVGVEAEIDFSDEGEDYMDNNIVVEIKNLKNNFSSFLGGCINKKMMARKNKVLLVGPVNSGKSSVFNRLLGFERAIVSSVPGTTRDLISSELFYESSVFSIQDSAGIRKTNDIIESVGIDLSLSEIENSDLVIGVFEGSEKPLIKNFKALTKNTFFISVQNKIDIHSSEKGFFDCYVSAKTGAGFDNLKNLILSFFNNSTKQKYDGFLVRDRHEVLFNGVLKSLESAEAGLVNKDSLELVAEDLKFARSYLDELVGKKFSDSLLGDIFKNYCIGK